MAQTTGFDGYQPAQDQYGSPGGGGSGASAAQNPPGQQQRPDRTSDSANEDRRNERRRNPSRGAKGDRQGADAGRSGGVAAEQGSELPFAQSRRDGLPFTGWNLLSVALMALALIGSGFALRATTRGRRRSPRHDAS